jgi:hypothetical protein
VIQETISEGAARLFSNERTRHVFHLIRVSGQLKHVFSGNNKSPKRDEILRHWVKPFAASTRSGDEQSPCRRSWHKQLST